MSLPGNARAQKRRDIFFALLLIVTVLALGVTCQSNGDTWQRIETAGVLRVGLDPTYPPFEVADGTDLRGLDVDLAKALADDLGLEATFVYFGYDGLYDALATEQVDVLISALVVAPERREDFTYSEPYFNAGQILIVPQANNTIGEMADLAGQTVAVELGALGHVEATEWSRRIPNLTIQPYDDPQTALNAVVEGSADAVLIDSVSGRLFLADTPALKRLPTAVTVEPYALVVRKKDEVLLEKLNTSLAHLKAAGLLDEIVARWLGP